MTLRTAKIGPVEIPLACALDLDISEQWFGGETTLRTISGAGIKQVAWHKLRLTISGRGWIPPGLAGLDTSQQHVVASCVPSAITADANRQATLPATRRSDLGYEPWAWAIMPDGSTIDANLTLVGSLATAAVVSGATGYQILYYPQITAWVSRPDIAGSRSTAGYQWQIVAEQV